MVDVTRILSQFEDGDPSAAQQLLPLVYDELRRLAAQRLDHENRGDVPQATSLVHEAYLRLVDTDRVQHFTSRGHFFAAAAESMRRILVERARRRAVGQRAAAERNRLDGDGTSAAGLEQLLAVHDVLDKLAAVDPPAAELVKLRFFVGLTMEEAAEALGISVRTAQRLWAYARSWLRRELGRD